MANLIKPAEDYKRVYDLGNGTVEITFRAHIPAPERTMLLERVEELYFPNGNYDPAYGDLAVSFILACMYTDATFDGDIDVFEQVNNRAHIVAELPKEAHELMGSVHEKVVFLERKNSAPAEQKKMYVAISELCGKGAAVMSGVLAYLNNAEKALSKESDVSLSEMLKVMQNLSRQDEKKITAAILDYQAEKAKKRVAVKPDAEK